mmetsp:Transcript_90839/g.257309  ORF Transcript_90839/g.257309 Transcript_90839/m.257309 type:complete len:107 (+) Transcript_90839:67-387(+)
MAIRSLRVARAYRDLCRAATQAFQADFGAQRMLRSQVSLALRQHVAQLSEDDMVDDLKGTAHMLRTEVVQASYRPDTGTYRAHITQDHLSRGVVDLRPPPDPAGKP